VTALLAVQEVSKRFVGLQALRDVSFAVRAGEVLALIGPNGAGKTTLLNVICGALRPTSGSVLLRGRLLSPQPPHVVSREGIARTFQSLELFRQLTVRENVMAGGVARTDVGVVASLLGLPAVRRQRALLEDEAAAHLKLVGLEHRADETAAALPAGQQRLLAIARALANGGEVLVLDEPGAGLNQTEKTHLADVIARLPERGKTVVFVEHDMTLVGRLADRIVVLNHGEKIAEGSPEAIRSDPRVVEAYLGIGGGAIAPQRAARSAHSTPMLRVRDVEVAYGGLRALHDVSLEVYPGEIVALVGANGAGKTTLLKAVARVVPLQLGTISFEGADLAQLTPQAVVRGGISMVPEGRELFPSLTVWDNLVLGRYSKGRAWRDDLERLTGEMFALFPVLAQRRRQLAGTLSGGEGQMLAIARALMSAPRLLMLDEPSLGLAPQVVAEIMERLARLRETGLTIVLVEQNARAALELADRGYVLETGRVATTGSGAVLLADPEISSAYLGRATDRLRPVPVTP
jgi:branched-chain amino acid transport system ATP-binding protein